MRRTACGCEVGDEAVHGGLDQAERWARPVQQRRTEGPGVPLDRLGVGARARIVAVSVPGLPALERRLEDLGFVPGTSVEVLRRAPLGDPLMYRVCDYDLCLRRAQAARVFVEPSDARRAGDAESAQ